MPKLSNTQLYDRLKEATMTDDEGISETDRNLLETQLHEFSINARKLEPFMKKLKDDMGKYL